MNNHFAPSELAWRDLVSECLAALVARPARSALTTLGVILGTGTFVAVVGLVNTASSQISERFNDLVATSVTATDARSNATSTFPFPTDADGRMSRLNGVVAAGTLWFVDTSTGDVRGASTAAVGDTDVWAASAGAWGAIEPSLVKGRVFDAFADESSARVVLVGASVADRLGIDSLAQRPSILIQGVPFTVIGVFGDTVRHPELLLSAVIPRGTAETLWGTPEPSERATVTVVTQVGAATQVADELPLALAPASPSSVVAVPPPDPRTLRDKVDSDLSGLFIIVALICLLVGAVGIANTTLVAVIERTPEMGLRRALGATRRHIAVQTLCESSLLGLMGGLLGTCLGILTVVAVALSSQWTPTLPLYMVVSTPLIGLTVGALAGLYPASRASKIEPTEALRS